jgi:broad specificity phosphatase PhoE
VTRLVLIRHAEPEASVRGRVYGALDVGLSERGLRDAEKLASTVRGLDLDAVYASPLRRAIETATPLARERGLELTLHEGLREVDFGELEGRTYEEIGEDHADLFRVWATSPSAIRFPGGEDYVGLKARVLTAVEEIRERTTSAAIVAHGGVNRVVLADALDLPDDAIFRLDQPYCALSVIDWIDGSPLVRAVNASVESAAWLAR